MIAVVGAGAAGLAAAIFARTGGEPVTLIERTQDGGRKILISGGGRCNVLPEALEPHRFVTSAPSRLCGRILKSWPLREQVAFFESDVGVPLKLEADTRKFFPKSDRARDVRDGLVVLARARGVEFQFETTLSSLAPRKSGWRVETSAGAVDARCLIIATGGLSVPATGSDGTGLRLVEGLGHAIRGTYPALTPLTATPPRHAGLAGVSLDVRLRARWQEKTREATGGFLFTHRGYSGPTVLDLSDVAVRSLITSGDRASLRVQWTEMGFVEWDAALQSSPALVVTIVAKRVPQRLAEQLVHEAGVPLDRSVAELRRTERLALVERLTSYELPWTGDEGYQKAEVTGGGVALEEVDPVTLESRCRPSLFLCGEMLDAFGPIGGHNFAWAWATGRLAGLGAARHFTSNGRE